MPTYPRYRTKSRPRSGFEGQFPNSESSHQLHRPAVLQRWSRQPYPPLSQVRLQETHDHEHKATMHYGISTSCCRKKKYTMIRIGKLVAVSTLDDQGSTLEVNRIARRQGKADSEVSMWESRLQEII